MKLQKKLLEIKAVALSPNDPFELDTGIMILMVLFGCSKQASLTKKIDKN